MKTALLGTVATWGSGGTPKRGVAEYFGGGHPWLSISDLNDGPVENAKESLTDLGLANSSAKLVPPDTLLVAMYGSIGKLGVTTKTMCTSQAIAFAIPDPTQVDARYLFHFLLAERPRLQAHGRGGTQMNISQGDLKKWPMPRPPLEEQRRIAAILDQADAVRAKRRQVLAHLAAFPNVVFNTMFGKLSWTSTVGELAQVRIGPFGSLLHKGDYVHGGVPLINPMHIAAGEVTPDPDFTVLADKAATLETYRMLPGDVVLGRRGEMGRAAILPAELDGAICGTGSVFLRPAAGTSQFLQSVLASPRMKRHLERNAQGATLLNLNTRIVSTAPAPPAPQSQLAHFTKALQAAERAREQVRCAAANDDALFSALQARAFRGEL